MSDSNHTWDNLRAMMELAAPDSMPLVEQVNFHYEAYDVTDGTGDERDTIVNLRGATIEVRMR